MKVFLIILLKWNETIWKKKECSEWKEKRARIYYSIPLAGANYGDNSSSDNSRVREKNILQQCHIQLFYFRLRIPHVWCFPYLFMRTYEMVKYLQTTFAVASGVNLLFLVHFSRITVTRYDVQAELIFIFFVITFYLVMH